MSCELTTAEVEYIDGRMADLQAENERLRERINELEMEGSKAFYNEAYTRDENTKLRELVRDWYDFECLGCGSCNYGVLCQQRADAVCIAPMLLKDRMRELGVEV